MKTEYRGFMARVSKKGAGFCIIIPKEYQKYYESRDWVMVEPLVLIDNRRRNEDV